jgi:hypothetical protein
MEGNSIAKKFECIQVDIEYPKSDETRMAQVK